MSLNNRIDNLIRVLGVKQYQFAEKSKLSPQIISKIINQGSDARISTIESILINHKDVNARWLITGEGEMFTASSTLQHKISSEKLDTASHETNTYKFLYEVERQKNEELYGEIGSLRTEVGRSEERLLAAEEQLEKNAKQIKELKADSKDE